MYNIEIYTDKYGKSEIKNYITKLKSNNDKNSKIKFNKIVAYIRMLENNGICLGEPFIKHIINNIWELRPLRDRILFAHYDNNKIILLNIFMKKTQKTPKNEIEKAIKLYEDYKKRSI